MRRYTPTPEAYEMLAQKVGKEKDESWEDLLVSENAVDVTRAHRARAVDI
jgi:hypothetical protein